MFAAVVAVALPLYWLREPTRQDQSTTYFDKNAGRPRRGAVRELGEPDVRRRDVAAVRELPRRRRAAAASRRPRSTASRSDWKAPPLNTESLRFNEDPDCSNTRAAADARLRGHRHHHVRPAGHADAAVGCRRRRPEERPGDPGPRRVHPVDPAHAGASRRRQAAENLDARAAAAAGAARRREGRAQRRPDRELADDRRHAVRSTPRRRRSRPRSAQPATTSTDDLRATCKALETELDDAGRARGREPSRSRRRRAATSSTRPTTTTDAAAALAWSQAWFDRAQNVSDGQLLFELNCARCHTEGWSMFDPTAAATARRRRARPARRRRRPRRRHRLQPARRRRRSAGSVTDATGHGGFDSQVDFVSDGFRRHKPYGNARHRHRQDARLRRDAHARDDQRRSSLRALLPRQHDLPRRPRPTDDGRYRRRQPPRPRRPEGERHECWSRARPARGRRHEPLEPDDPRRPRRAVAVGLFCGSAYLLLGTNLGARLGFLVAGACLSGFLVLLTSLWLTTATPLDPPARATARLEGGRGRRRPERVEDRGGARHRRQTATRSTRGLAQLRPRSTPRSCSSRPTAASNRRRSRSRTFGSLAPTTSPTSRASGPFTIGGGTKNLFWHHPRYAAVEFCTALEALRSRSSATGAGVRPAAAEAVRDPRATTTARCASRRASTSSRRSCCSGCRCSACTGTRRTPANARRTSRSRPVPDRARRRRWSSHNS